MKPTYVTVANGLVAQLYRAWLRADNEDTMYFSSLFDQEEHLERETKSVKHEIMGPEVCELVNKDRKVLLQYLLAPLNLDGFDNKQIAIHSRSTGTLEKLENLGKTIQNVLEVNLLVDPLQK